MSKKPKSSKSVSKKQNFPGYEFITAKGGFSEYRLKTNDLTVIHYEMPGTGVVTSNITYQVGSRDEQRGETGLAHMLEHMVFKPTKEDLQNKIDSGSMQFERETGCILNANTWKDRTTYFFSYPKNYTARALHVEADRMQNVIISDKEFLPERNNVLSEFDMNNGDPEFALCVAMVGAAFLSHPYGHETIGFREDIEAYTSKKLDNFYKLFYSPNNATLMIFGDIKLAEALKLVKKEFSTILNSPKPIIRHGITEPKQEGTRRTDVVRESSTNLLGIGFKHPGFPTIGWYEAGLLLDVLTDGPESILHKVLVDTGKAIRVESMLEPTSETNLGAILITLAPGTPHEEIETLVLKTVSKLDTRTVSKLLTKIVENAKTDLFFSRGSSLKIAMDMTEFAGAGDWSDYLSTEEKLSSITAKDIITHSETLFATNNLTIGRYIGKK